MTDKFILELSRFETFSVLSALDAHINFLIDDIEEAKKCLKELQEIREKLKKATF